MTRHRQVLQTVRQREPGDAAVLELERFEQREEGERDVGAGASARIGVWPVGWAAWLTKSLPGWLAGRLASRRDGRLASLDARRRSRLIY